MKKFNLLFASFILSLLMSFTVFAGEWKQDNKGWWYQDDDNTFPTNQWKQIEGKQYYFGSDGYMLSNTITPDGYQVGADGSWTQENTSESKSIQLSTVTSIPSTVIGEGIYKVGTDIAAGEYVLFCNSKYSGYFSINKDSTGSFSSIISNGNFEYNAIVSVKNGEYLEVNRCTFSPISEIPQIDYTKGNMFKVGYHIPSGEYKIQSNSEYPGYYAVLSDLNGGINSIVTNNNFNGQAYITVREGQYFELSRCNIIQ